MDYKTHTQNSCFPQNPTDIRQTERDGQADGTDETNRHTRCSGTHAAAEVRYL